MRRKDSKDHFKAYKALLDAFVASTRSGDVPLSSSLYRAIQLTDSTGKLAEIAQSYAQAIQSPDADKKGLAREFEYKFGKTTVNLPTNTLSSDASSDADTLMDIFTSMSPELGTPDRGSDSDIQSQNAGSATANSRLAFIAQNVLSRGPEYVDAACQTDRADKSPQRSQKHDRRIYTAGSSPEDRPLTDFDEVQAFWSKIPETKPMPLGLSPSPTGFGYDFNATQAEDPMSKAILEFRDGARHAIQNGAKVGNIIGTSTPSLENFFSQDTSTPVYSAWSWACQFARALALPLTLHLCTIYMVGIQMRVR